MSPRHVESASQGSTQASLLRTAVPLGTATSIKELNKLPSERAEAESIRGQGPDRLQQCADRPRQRPESLGERARAIDDDNWSFTPCRGEGARDPAGTSSNPGATPNLSFDCPATLLSESRSLQQPG